jgi:hypothetical protein
LGTKQYQPIAICLLLSCPSQSSIDGPLCIQQIINVSTRHQRHDEADVVEIGLLVIGAFYYEAPDWDISISFIMALM